MAKALLRLPAFSGVLEPTPRGTFAHALPSMGEGFFMRIKCIVFFVGTLAVIAPSLSTPSSADTTKDCVAASGEDGVNGCQELIRSRRFKGHGLAMVYNNLGAAYSGMGDHEHAVDAYSNALRVEARYVLPRVNRARSLAAIGRFEDAVVDMDAVIKLAATAENYSVRADLRERNNDLDGSLSDYGEAVKRQPKVADYYRNRGSILAKLSRHADAIEEYSRAIQLNSRDPSLYFSRGLAWANAGKCDQAVPDYTKAIEQSPRFANAYNNRGVCLGRVGKRDEAIADFEAALKYEPGNEKARENLARSREAAVPRVQPPVIEVPKFAIPEVKEILKVPEYSIEAAPAEADLEATSKK